MCLYGILLSLAHLYSEFLSNSIKSNVSDLLTCAKEPTKLMLLFDYLYEKILCNQSLQNTSYTVIFLNIILSNKHNYHFFNVHYSNLKITKMLKENNLDIGLLPKSIITETKNKNMALVSYIQQNPFYIILMKNK